MYAKYAVPLSKVVYETAPADTEQERELRKLELDLDTVGARLVREPEVAS